MENTMNEIEPNCDDIFINQLYQSFPKEIFHYTRKSTAEQIFNNKCLWLNKYSLCTGDDSEFVYGLKVTQEELVKKRYEDGFAHEFMTKKYADVFLERSKLEITPYISCFSLEPNNEYLWANYADSRQGKCIRFKFSTSSFDQQQRPFCRGYVGYEENTFRSNISQIIDQYILLYKKNCHAWFLLNKGQEYLNEIYLRLTGDLTCYALFLKNKEKYSKENEFRIVEIFKDSGRTRDLDLLESIVKLDVFDYS